jgi:hypothetical protein
MSRGAIASLAVVAACGALAFGAVAHGDDGPRVVVRDAGGEVVAEQALPADGRFALAYRHSVYQAPAQERFRALPGGRFALESIASPSRRVLEYYEAEGRIARDVLVPAHQTRFTTMALAATERGRRTLVVGSERVPLYGHGVHLRIAVEGT